MLRSRFGISRLGFLGHMVGRLGISRSILVTWLGGSGYVGWVVLVTWYAYAYAIGTRRRWALGSSGKLRGALGGSGGSAINFHCENSCFFAKFPKHVNFMV